MKRPIVWMAIFTICGIYMRLGISEMMCLASFAFITLAISHFVMKERSAKYLLYLLFVLLGFFLAGTEDKGEENLNGVVRGNGIVREAGKTAGGNQKLTIFCDLEDMEGNRLWEQKAYVLWSGEEQFTVGDCVAFTGELVAFYEASYPGSYDEKLYLTTKGFDCKIYPDEMRKTGLDTSLTTLLAKGRFHLQDALDSILPAEESGIMKAMLTGEKDDIPDEVYDLYTKAGVTHILCISGLHMSILAMYVSILLEKILKQSRRMSALVTMLAAVGFLAFIGVTPSATRAVTMICVVMLGRIVFQVTDRLNNIAIAALLILLMQPLYLFHAGFQLSFITVIGICLGVEKMEKRKKKKRGRFDWLKESLLVSAYASLFSFPVVAYHFYSISLVGILANLVILPLSGLLLGFGILAGLLGLFCMPLAVFAAGSVYVILQIFKGTCLLLTKLPFAYVLVGRPSQLTILLCFMLILFVVKLGERKGSWKAGVVLCTALWCSVFGNRIFCKENAVAFLDVGQGDAAVVSTYDGKAYLIDGGGIYGKEFGEDVGISVILPYLEYLGIDELEGAFLSHPDSDHMTGLLEIFDTIPVKGLYLSDYAFADTEQLKLCKEMVEKNNVPLYTVKMGDVSADGMWECLYPLECLAFQDGDDNHGSMVLRYEYGRTKVLFTGDIGALDEQLMMEQKEDLSADILKVSHHGSKYSSEVEFLEAVSPKAAVISCGAGNLYGHPHEATLERLQEVTELIYRTDMDGSILVTLSPDGTWDIETMTERKPFYERAKETVEKS